VEVVRNWKIRVPDNVNNRLYTMIGVQSTGFLDQFVVVSSASEVITVFSLWRHEQT